MLLAIDAGNTNTTFAIMRLGGPEDGKVAATWRLSTDARRTADEYAVWLTHLMALEGLTPGDVTACIIANVVPEAAYNLERLCRRYFGREPLRIGEPGLDLGIDVVIDRPEEVGADRLVNAVAAVETYGTGLIVIDFGTATTFDLIDRAGAYAGGVIAPGINLSLDALRMAAAKLPGVAIRKPDRVVGRGTVSAMQSGIFWGYVGLIEGLVARMAAEAFGGREDVRVVATGGLATLFVGASDAIDASDPDLTLRGLHLIYRRTGLAAARPSAAHLE